MFVETLIAFYLHMQFSNFSAVGDPFRARSPNNIKIIHDNIAREIKLKNNYFSSGFSG